MKAGAAPAAGEGVAGGAEGAFVAGAGAEGAAGVDAWMREEAGVLGACEGPEGLDEAGCALGFKIKASVSVRVCLADSQVLHTLETMQTTKPFSSMLYDSIVLAS